MGIGQQRLMDVNGHWTAKINGSEWTLDIKD